MRIKFHLGRVEYDHQTVVIILNVAHRVVGMVVDGVSDVLTLQTDQIMPAPEFGATLTTEYLTGLGTVDGRMLILMDIEKLMSSREMALIETLGGAARAGISGESAMLQNWSIRTTLTAVGLILVALAAAVGGPAWSR